VQSLSREYQKAVDLAYSSLGSPSADPESLPEPHRSIVFVDTCLGLIENGGIEYLFEAELPHCPSYQVIAGAFRNCGAHAAACLFEQAAALLPGPDPHLHPEARHAFLASPTAEFAQIARLANDAFWGDSTITERVAKYAHAGKI
jgi:hypothetical protein